MQIETTKGKREIIIEQFSALDGWEIQNDYIHFVQSNDPAFRQNYTLTVLRYVKIILPENKIAIPLSTPQLVDEHLGNWSVLDQVFRAVLKANGIDPDTHADDLHYWDKVGKKLAASFLTGSIALMAPFIQENGIEDFVEKVKETAKSSKKTQK